MIWLLLAAVVGLSARMLATVRELVDVDHQIDFYESHTEWIRLTEMRQQLVFETILLAVFWSAAVGISVLTIT